MGERWAHRGGALPTGVCAVSWGCLARSERLHPHAATPVYIVSTEPVQPIRVLFVLDSVFFFPLQETNEPVVSISAPTTDANATPKNCLAR